MKIRSYPTAIIALAVVAAVFGGVMLVRGQQSSDVTSRQYVTVHSIEEAQRLVEFPLALPVDVPPELEFHDISVGTIREGVQRVTLLYPLVQGESRSGTPTNLLRRSVQVTEAPGDATLNDFGQDRSTTVDLQGTTGRLLRGEDIGNPGLVVVKWRKGGLALTGRAFPDDRFTEEDLIRFLSSFE